MADTEYKIVPNKESAIEKNHVDPPRIYGYGVRHVQALLYFTCLSILYASRGHLGVTIVAMTVAQGANTARSYSDNTDGEHTRILQTNDTTTNNTITNNITNGYTNKISYPTSEAENINAWNVYKTYNWPKSTQEMVLGAFFFGYCIMMFPFGLVCQKFGGKLPLQIALFISAFISFFTPWLVAWGGWKVLCASRILMGMSQAGLYPALTTLLSNWVPARERGSLSSYVLTGSGFGTIAAFQAAGLLGFSNFGWPSTFWVIGILSIIGFVLITVYGAHNPDAYHSISEEEKIYIMGDIGQRVVKTSKTPWRSIWTSVPAWSTFVAHTGSAIIFVFFFTQVPTYMFAILKLNIRNSGLLSSLPYIAAFFTCMSFGYLSDLCTNKKILSVSNARKCSNSFASIIPAICLVLVSYVTNTALAVTCFVVSLAAHASMHTGWMVNYMDLSPNYSGAMMALGNTLANIFVTILPIIVSNVVTDVTNHFQWRIMMYLMAAISLISNTMFVLFMSADLQPWNNKDTTNDLESEDIKQKISQEKK